MKPTPEMSREELMDYVRGLKRMVRNVVPKFPLEASDQLDFARASGLAICPQCGLEYFDHPAVDQDDLLTIACDGRILKL
ncbi:hypothetical protein [Sphingomonas sp.]|uniref:hypothetical protein n=1 Tax=Sphingomonas sp. TaxID=28214 RepID=UPI0025E49308|nr:hypothetical protein [Sphingomonas sp.]